MTDIPPLNVFTARVKATESRRSREDMVINQICARLHAAYERQHGPTEVEKPCMGPKVRFVPKASPQRLAARECLRKNPTASVSQIALELGCSIDCVRRAREDVRKEGKS